MLASMADKPYLTVEKRAFLRAFEACGIIGTACKTAKVSRRTVTQWREEDEEFEEAFSEAYETSIDPAEEALRHRALFGFEKPVIYQGIPMWRRDPLTGEVLLDDDFNPIPLTEPVQNNDLLKVYLAGNRGKYSTKVGIEHSGPGGGPLPKSVEVVFIDADGKGGILKEGEEPEPDPYATENDRIET